MKKCPFCRNIITEDFDNCSHCGRVLVERINSRIKHSSETILNGENFFEKLSDKFSNISRKLNSKSLKKYIPIICLLLVITLIVLNKGSKIDNPDNTPVSVIPKSATNPFNNLANFPAQKNEPIKSYTSLINGEVLFKMINYFNGLGKLTISNGTDLDAIAKLVDTKINKSVLTFFIKANDTYTINKISDSEYKLFFNLGNNWSDEFKAFTVNSSYEVFEEVFNFVTSEYEDGDYIRTRYATYSVTLNPIIGGQARTEDVSNIEFGKY